MKDVGFFGIGNLIGVKLLIYFVDIDVFCGKFLVM